MKAVANQLPGVSEFIVRGHETDSNGKLSICRILGEITSLYDAALIQAFGDSAYTNVLNSSYQIDFLEPVYEGGIVRAVSEAVLYFGATLEVYITLKRLGSKDKTVAKGHFIFTLQTIPRALPLSLS